MLNDIRDLLEEEDDLYPSEEQNSRRRYYIIGGVVGGIVLLLIICMGVYAIFLGPGGSDEDEEASRAVETQLALATDLPTETRVPPSATPSPVPPSETLAATPTVGITQTAVPSETPIPPTEPPTLTPTTLPTTTPSVIFLENFEGSGGVWPDEVRENYEYGIVNGEFRFSITSSNIEAWTVRQRTFQDVRSEADITVAPGNDDGYAGLICRFQDGFNFYAGIINGAGEYAIVRRLGTQLIELAGPEQSDASNASGEVNRLRLDCVGSDITLFVNGVKVLETSDQSYAEGQVGLVAGTLETPGLEAYFDNYIIARP